MTATAQAAPRKQFRLSRYKAEEPAVVIPAQSKPTSTHPALRLDGGSRQTRPFDPSELSRRLEVYQQELKLARAKREIADLNERHRRAREAMSLQDRNDSGHDSEGKTETSSIEEPAELREEDAEYAVAEEMAEEEEEEEEEEGANEQEAESARLPELQKPTSVRRPRMRRPSSARSRRNPAGTYFPRFAAKQFAATTTPLVTKAPTKKPNTSSSKRHDSRDATDVPNPKQTFADNGSDVPKPKQPSADGFIPKQTLANGSSMPKPVDRAEASAPDLNTVRDNRRRSAVLFSDLGSPSSARNAHNATTRPRPLSTALENLNFLDDGDDDDTASLNPYILSSRKQDVAEAEKQGPLPRPVIKYHDHHNDWSQASQCGDSARSSLHLHSIWRKDSVSKKGDAKQRGKIRGNVPDDQTMVADAVKLVKEERKKSSLLGFFKRHH